MPYETHDYKDHRIAIDHEDDPMNPRTDYDPAGTMLCWHGRYNLGDDHNWVDPHDAVADLLNIDMEEYADKYKKASEALKDAPVVVLPLYLYDHSGITMATTPFSCQWDSGQVGFIYITYENLHKELMVTDPLPDWKPNDEQTEKALAMLKGEVSTYDDYLTGNVWRYTIHKLVDGEPDETTSQSCGGFIGDPEHCLEAAKEELNG